MANNQNLLKLIVLNSLSLSLSKSNKRLFVLLLFTHGLFFFVKVSLGNFYLADSYEYLYLAENIKNHFEFYSGNLDADINFENYTKRPPLYSLFFLVTSFLLNSKISILIAQNTLSIVSILLCIKLFKKSFPRLNQNIAVLFLLTSVSQFIYSNYLMTEILFQFLSILLCYQFHLIMIKKKTRHLICFQILIILLLLTKPIFYLFVVPNIVLGIWLAKHIKRAFVFSLMPLLICALYMSWNYKRTGRFEFSSIQNINLVNYNLYYFHTNKYGEAYAKTVNLDITEEAMKEPAYADQQNTLQQMSLHYIKKDLISYGYLHFKGALKMFLDPGRFDLYNFFEFKNSSEVGFLKHYNKNGITGAFNYFKTQPLIILIAVPILLLLNIIKFVGFILFWKKNYKTTPQVFWLMLFLIVYVTSLSGLVGASRYLVAVLPMYLLFAVLGYSKKYNEDSKNAIPFYKSY